MSAAETEILREVRAIRAEQAKMLSLVAPLLTRKISRTEQAAQAGVSTTTLWRREKAAQRKLMLEGLA